MVCLLGIADGWFWPWFRSSQACPSSSSPTVFALLKCAARDVHIVPKKKKRELLIRLQNLRLGTAKYVRCEGGLMIGEVLHYTGFSEETCDCRVLRDRRYES